MVETPRHEYKKPYVQRNDIIIIANLYIFLCIFNLIINTPTLFIPISYFVNRSQESALSCHIWIIIVWCLQDFPIDSTLCKGAERRKMWKSVWAMCRQTRND